MCSDNNGKPEKNAKHFWCTKEHCSFSALSSLTGMRSLRSLSLLNTKAELQTMETIMVVVIIIIMILVGMAFFYKYTLVGIDNDYKDYQKSIFDNSIFTFPQQAEIVCSKNAARESCLDAYKMIGFADAAAKKKDFYRAIYGYKNITLEIVYPKPEKRGMCSREKLEECSIYLMYLNVPKEGGKQRVIMTPVAVYLPQSRSYAIGVLTISGYKVGV